MKHGSANARPAALVTVILLLVISSACAISTAFAVGSGGITERVSVGSGSPGAQGNGGVVSAQAPAVTPDGRYVAFSSTASNTVASDTNSAVDVFVRDRLTNTTERVSLTSTGSQSPTYADSGADGVSISADGRYVAFTSGGQLTANSSGGYKAIYVRDRLANTTTMVSVPATQSAPNGDSYQPSISADGRYVVFASSAENLIAGDNNTTADVFRRDLQTGTTTRVSVATGGGQLTSECMAPSISGDGRYIAFQRTVYDVATFHQEIWVRDVTSATLTRLSIPPVGTVNGDSTNPVVSQDGSYVAFATSATNIWGAPGNGQRSVIRISTSGSTASALLVSQSSGGAEGNGASEAPAISSTGRYVAFASDAANLVTSDSNAKRDVFVRDCAGSATTLVSQSTAGSQGSDNSYAPAVSGDGSYIAFNSSASNLVTGDTNAADDIFGRLIDATAPVTTAQLSSSANGMGWWKQDVTVTLSATDTASGSGVAGTSYTLNGGGANPYSAPFTINTPGTTNLGYYSSDNAGNTESAKTLAIKIDKVAPTLTLDAAPGSSHNAPYSVSALPSDALSGIDTTQDVEMNVDGGTWYKERSIPVAVGAHTVNARVSDNAGNQQTASVSITVNASVPDTVAPHTSTDTSPAPGTWVNASTAPKSFTATDDASGVSQIVWRLNAGAKNTLVVSPAESSVITAPVIPWVQGVNTLYFYSIDASGNAEATRSVTVSYDGIAPGISFDVAAVTYNTGSRTVNANVSDAGSGANASTIQMRIDSGSWQSGSSIVVPLGTHTVSAKVSDNAGNSAEATSVTFTVAPAPAKVTLATPKISGTPRSTRYYKYYGYVYPGHAVRVSLVIQRYSSGKYRTYKTVYVTANSAGAWSTKLKLKRGSYRMYCTTPASASWLAAKSGMRSFKVR